MNFTRTALFGLILVATSVAPGFAQSYAPGEGFQLGGTYFHVVSVSADGEALFRVTERLDPRGVEEHPDCYRVMRTFYHQEACPVLQAHFAHHGEAADSAPEAGMTRAGYAAGDHPVDYVRGSYVERSSYQNWPAGAFFLNSRNSRLGVNRFGGRSRFGASPLIGLGGFGGFNAYGGFGAYGVGNFGFGGFGFGDFGGFGPGAFGPGYGGFGGSHGNSVSSGSFFRRW